MKLYIKICILVFIITLNFVTPLTVTAGDVEKKELLEDLDVPYGIALDDDGNIYFTEYQGGTIKMLPKGGTQPVTILSNLTNPYDVAIDKAGNLIFSEKGGGKLSVMARDGDVKLILSEVGRIYGITVGPDDYIYITVFGSPVAGGTGALLKTDLTGDYTILLPELDYPVGIAVDSEGNLYFTEYSTAGRLNVLFSDGLFRTLLTDLNTPTGVAVDEKGNIYFSDLSNGTIKVLSADFSKVKTVATNLTSPWDLTYHNGDIYIAVKSVNGTITQIHLGKPISPLQSPIIFEGIIAGVAAAALMTYLYLSKKPKTKKQLSKKAHRR